MDFVQVHETYVTFIGGSHDTLKIQAHKDFNAYISKVNLVLEKLYRRWMDGYWTSLLSVMCNVSTSPSV